MDIVGQELLLYLALSALFLAAHGYVRTTAAPQRIDDLLSDKIYFKQDPPIIGGVTEVGIGVYINRFYSISEQTMDYQVGMYLRQRWTDPRLERQQIDNKVSSVKLEGAWTKIWIPDTIFRNEKRSILHSVTVENRMTSVNFTGVVWYVMKITATLSCPMQLHKYPLDTQTCPMIFESFGYASDTVRLKWIENPVDVEEARHTLPQFFFKQFKLNNCSQNFTSGTSLSCLEIAFVLRRDLGYYFIQLFVPSMLIVILSWVSFWINVDAAPARVSLGLLTVLTMTNHSIGINANLPRVSYIKAVDVWMSSCLLFVFAALCEYAFVNVASRHRVLAKTAAQAESKPKCCSTCIQINPPKLERDDPMAGIGGGNLALPPKPAPVKPLDADGKSRAREIDKIARKSFPLAFVLFNFVYWVGYTYEP